MRPRCGTAAALVVTLACLSFAAVAQAEPFPTVTDAIAIADQQWPDSPCAGHLTVISDPALAGSGLDGWTEFDGSCVIRIASDLGGDSAHRCDIIVHEGGHRAGLGHSEHGIMRADPEPWPPCHSVRPAIIARIRSMLPTHRGVWRVTCPDHGTAIRCRATGPRVKPQIFAVTIFPTLTSGPDFEITRLGVRRLRLR